jgi:hypothetical protein
MRRGPSLRRRRRAPLTALDGLGQGHALIAHLTLEDLGAPGRTIRMISWVAVSVAGRSPAQNPRVSSMIRRAEFIDAVRTRVRGRLVAQPQQGAYSRRDRTPEGNLAKLSWPEPSG